MSAGLPLTDAELCSARSDRNRSSLLLRSSPQLLILGIAALYLWLPTRNYYWDGISFATAIENSPGLSKSLIHPHHLLYNVFGYGLYQITQLLGFHLRAIHVLQISNGIMSACCAWLLFRVARHIFRSILLATLLTLAFSFSATWWKYSTDADAYIPSVLLLLVCFNLLLTATKTRPIALALAHAAGMCLHQLAIFFYPVIVIGILLRPGQSSLRQRWCWVLEYSGVASLITLATNYYCFHLQTGSSGLVAFSRWLTSYVQGPDSYSFNFDLLSNLGYTLRAQVRLFFEGRFNWIEGVVSFPLIVLIGVLVVLILMLGWRFFRALPALQRPRFTAKIDERFQPLAAICVVWLSVYVVFLFFWYPYFTPYRVFSLPPLICLGGVLLAQKSQELRTNVAMLVAAMAISNFVFFIFPLSHSEKYPPLSFALNMRHNWPANTLIYFTKSNADNQMIRYFNSSTDWRSLDRGASVDMFESELHTAYRNGATVWFETSAIDEINSTKEGAAWLAAHTTNGCSQKLANDSYRIEFVQIFPNSMMAQAKASCSPAASLHENTF
jgi:hypothetical protein